MPRKGRAHAPNHAADGPRRHVFQEAWEEGLLDEVLVVLSQQVLARFEEFHGTKLIAALLEALDDFANEASLHAIGLDHDISSLHLHAGRRSPVRDGVPPLRASMSASDGERMNEGLRQAQEAAQR